MELILIIALVSLIAGLLVFAVLTQKALLAQLERDRRSLDSARLEIVALKNPQAAAIAIEGSRARTADGVEEFMRSQGVLPNGADPDEGSYG